MNNNPYLQMLTELGHKSHNENKPLYKYTKIDTFKTILKNNALRFGNPEYYNDPFEFSDDCFHFEIEDAPFRDLLRFNVSKAPLDEQKQIEHLIDTFSKQKFIDVHKKRIEAYKRTALVFCTTISPLNRLMWAHYTDNHKGICFGIEIPFDFRNEKEMVVTKSVKYNPLINTQTILTNDQTKIMMAVYNWIYTKSEIWGYEDEMRTYRMRFSKIEYDTDYILPERINYEDIQFDKNALVEVHYGINTSQKDIDEVEELIRKYSYNNIMNRYKIQKVKGTYDIERIKV
ncbi:MAG: DUF2971 domain-containing protein [Taibaiella sp.]|nr:DUF2971 domain-containing protein [Taibaiella sp.]